MPIELVHGFLASYANLDQEGRFSVIGGGVDAIAVPTFPASVPVFAIVARLRVPADEGSRSHRVDTRVYRPDGTLIRTAEPVTINPIEEAGPRIGPLEHGIIASLVLNIYNMHFDAAGVYRFDFVEGDHTLGSLPVPVVDSAALRGA
jgi:hypothetical protein